MLKRERVYLLMCLGASARTARTGEYNVKVHQHVLVKKKPLAVTRTHNNHESQLQSLSTVPASLDPELASGGRASLAMGHTQYHFWSWTSAVLSSPTLVWHHAALHFAGQISMSLVWHQGHGFPRPSLRLPLRLLLFLSGRRSSR